MNALESAAATIFDRLYSHVNALGYFTNAQMHEPKSAPGADLTCSIWVASLTPIPAASGLASTTFRLELTARIYKPFLSQPEDLIDLNLSMATAGLIGLLSGDFDLGGSVRDVDLLGAHGAPLAAKAGYQTIGGTSYRIMDITIPIIFNDGADQGA
jgi:hypothetical protein